MGLKNNDDDDDDNEVKQTLSKRRVMIWNLELSEIEPGESMKK